ncbi:MAG: FadR family transcriptional regulator [Myxococcales bacterium]|nr:FadR family transcriptional regulator [Myxococcales bacterium]
MRGERAAGSRLPPVREMALEFGVTVPTIQRVVDRLEATGLVRARQGSGIVVNDPRESADLSLLPMWFDALVDQPERAGAILGDFLELRRVILSHLVRTETANLGGAAQRLAGIANRLVKASSLDEIIDADLEATRAVLETSNNFAALALFRAVEHLTSRVPLVAEALYGDRAAHRDVLARLAAVWLAGGEPAQVAESVEAVLAAWDRRTVERFTALLENALS